jgi:outer membrane protein OmpA-like peptidoglycan-associated protein
MIHSKLRPGKSVAHVPIAAMAALASLAVACAGAKPPVVQGGQASQASTAANAAPPSTRSTPGSSPTASNVSISDEIRARCGISDADAYFAFDSANVTTGDRTPLDLVVRCFTKGPLAGRSLKLVGRADPRGTTEYNMTLGQSRADAVEQYLDGRGMAKSKTESTTRGAMDASGTDDQGWQHDRRVDVLLGH